MNHKIDKLFKTKLAERQTAPSNAVWNQLQDQLKGKKKNKFALYYKIASIFLLLLILVSVYIFNNDRIQNFKENEIANNHLNKETPIKDSHDKSHSYNPEIVIPSSEINEDKELDLNKKQIVENKIYKKANHSQQNTLNKDESENKIVIVPFDPVIDTEKENLLANNNPDHKNITADTQSRPSITITYKKGNPSNEVSLVHASEENENTALKKFLKMAKDIKFSEISLADLRDSKEDLLGLEISKMKN